MINVSDAIFLLWANVKIPKIMDGILIKGNEIKTINWFRMFEN